MSQYRIRVPNYQSEDPVIPWSNLLPRSHLQYKSDGFTTDIIFELYDKFLTQKMIQIGPYRGRLRYILITGNRVW